MSVSWLHLPNAMSSRQTGILFNAVVIPTCKLDKIHKK